MLFLEFLRNKSRLCELQETADGVVRDLTGLESLQEQFKTYGPLDDDIMFHRAHNHHHGFAHIRLPTTSQIPEFQIPDLLFVSDSYLENLPKIYDVYLFRKLVQFYKEAEYKFADFFKRLETETSAIERFCFFINVSEILSEHVQQKKAGYSQEIADRITEKNLGAMGTIKIKKKIDPPTQTNFFLRVTAFILGQESSKTSQWKEEPLFDEDRLRLVLGNNSPYSPELYCEHYQDYDSTAARLCNATKPVNLLQIPKIDPLNFDIRPIGTPDFSKPSVSDENPLARQLNLFLPARRCLETEFWERYLGAQCVLPESAGR
jgi:hypothetical protein